MAKAAQSATVHQLAAAVKRALAETGISASFLRLWAGEVSPRLVASEPRLVTFKFSTPVPYDGNTYPGANRVGKLLTRVLSVRLSVRRGTDQAGDHGKLLSDEEAGLYALEEAATNALDGASLIYVDPVSEEETTVTIEAVMLLEGGEGPVTPAEMPGWAYSTLPFRVVYVAPYTLSTRDASIKPDTLLEEDV